MAIKISTKKRIRVYSRGGLRSCPHQVFGYQITGIKGLKYPQLPDQYVQQGGTSCWLSDDGLRLIGRFRKANGEVVNRVILAVGMFIDEATFTKRVKFIHECGENLRKVRKLIRAAEWGGDFEVTI